MIKEQKRIRTKKKRKKKKKTRKKQTNKQKKNSPHEFCSNYWLALKDDKKMRSTSDPK
jgi:hypothetical protein